MVFMRAVSSKRTHAHALGSIIVGINLNRALRIGALCASLSLISSVSSYTLPKSIIYQQRSPMVSMVHRRYLSVAAGSESGSGCNSIHETTSSGSRQSAALSSGKGVSSAPMSQSSLQPPKGTRDFYPDDFRMRQWLFGEWRKTAILFGFEEYDSSVLESEELYIRKSGDEIVNQLYNFQDKGMRNVSLRPEMTPTLSRMILARRKELQFPLKWFSIPQCWRYEKMGKGRRREHYQWNMDIWGVNGVDAEAELLGAIVHFLQSIGLTDKDVHIKVNSRKHLMGIMKHFGIEEDKWIAVCIQLDKLDKLPADVIKAEIVKLGVDSEICSKFVDEIQLPQMFSLESLQSESNSVKRLFDLSTQYGYSSWLQFDPTIVRGLSYYTDSVFEVKDRKGEFRAICGGGRYDHLLQSFTGKPESNIPAVGFGFGDAVIMELLKARNLLPDVHRRSDVDVVAFAMSEQFKPAMIATASRLRKVGINTDIIFDPKVAKNGFSRANSVAAKMVVMFAESEFANKQAVVKCMQTGQQHVCKLDTIDQDVLKLIGR